MGELFRLFSAPPEIKAISASTNGTGKYLDPANVVDTVTPAPAAPTSVQQLQVRNAVSNQKQPTTFGLNGETKSKTVLG